MAHFTDETFAFLFDLDVFNSRGWMDANRERYEQYVKRPLFAFCDDLAGPLREHVSPRLVSIGAIRGGSVFQIHRDTRFSKDKTPYKTAATAWFAHEDGVLTSFALPGLYLHLEPGNCFMAAGIYRPPTPTLTAVRDRIVATPGAWTRARNAVEAADFTLMGDQLKTAPRGFDRDHRHIDDLRRTSYVASRRFDEADATADDFLDRFVDWSTDALPLLRFIARALDAPL
ncbi:MAG: TIGR02453 family protein [Actinobacteria bacterium]|nr:TIGR02453 family protein [Actinomycetota bacterium]